MGLKKNGDAPQYHKPTINQRLHLNTILNYLFQMNITKQKTSLFVYLFDIGLSI
jgi:hypothetical protein